MEKTEFQAGDLVGSKVFEERVKRSGLLMDQLGFDAILLTKPQNMTYLVGNGRLCAFAIIAKNGATYVGVPKTDVEDTRKGSAAQQIIGFEDEVGMLHSLMHVWKELKLETGKVGVENTFLRVSMLDMLKHPHAKPEKLAFSDATELMTELRIIKSSEELEKIRKAGKVADKAMEAAVNAVKAGVAETEIAGEAEYAMRKNGAEEFFRTYVASGPRT
jgi:Xaa-Pro aminopeptidase